MELIITIAAIHLVACLSPGPDIFLVVLNSLRHGWRSGVATTMGILAGVLVHIALGITGISYLFTQGKTTQNAVALAGGAWLIYLGLRGLVNWNDGPHSRGDEAIPRQIRLPFSSALLQGLLVNLLNPKAFLYFVSLFSVLLGPEIPFSVKAGTGLTLFLVQAVAFSTVAFLVDRPRFKAAWKPLQRWLERGISIILLLLGTWIWLDILL